VLCRPNYFDNRDERRQQLAAIDAALLREYAPKLTSAGIDMRLIDVSSAFHRRRDRFYDTTHVFPHSSYMTKPTAFPRLLASTQTNMLKSAICSKS
jgi:hypothetical protein